MILHLIFFLVKNIQAKRALKKLIFLLTCPILSSTSLTPIKFILKVVDGSRIESFTSLTLDKK